MKLFSVSSPIIFYFSQTIASRNKKEDNLLFMWYMKGNERHLNSYNLMLEESVWGKEIAYNKAHDYNNISGKNILKAVNQIIKIEKEIMKIIVNNKIDEIFIGNRHAPIDRLLHNIGNKIGINVHLVEDGLTNYLDFLYYKEQNVKFLSKENFKEIVKKVYINVIKRKEIYDLSIELEFNDIYAVFDEKYSLQNYKDSVIGINFNDNKLNYIKLLDLLKEDNVYNMLLKTNNQETVLLLTQTLSEDGLLPIDKELELISNFLILYHKNKKVIIKPHPRDEDSKIEALINTLTQKGLDVILFTNNIPVPVELIITKLNIKNVIGIWSASVLYLPKIDNKIQTTSMLPFILNECENEVIDVSKLKRIYESLSLKFDNETNWL